MVRNYDGDDDSSDGVGDDEDDDDDYKGEDKRAMTISHTLA